jgi:tRNA (cytidine/uridine-2'-O-)-methyltransferase
MSLTLALFEPEIPQNTGTLLRLGACMNVSVDIIEPCGFVWNHPSFRRSVMDYMDHVQCRRYADFETFMMARPGRTIAVIVSGETPLYDFQFQPGDTLLFGKESTGIPSDLIHGLPSIHIPMPGRLLVNEGCRSLNLATAAAMVVAEAVRQVS